MKKPYLQKIKRLLHRKSNLALAIAIPIVVIVLIAERIFSNLRQATGLTLLLLGISAAETVIYLPLALFKIIPAETFVWGWAVAVVIECVALLAAFVSRRFVHMQDGVFVTTLIILPGTYATMDKITNVVAAHPDAMWLKVLLIIPLVVATFLAINASYLITIDACYALSRPALAKQEI